MLTEQHAHTYLHELKLDLRYQHQLPNNAMKNNGTLDQLKRIYDRIKELMSTIGQGSSKLIPSLIQQ